MNKTMETKCLCSEPNMFGWETTSFTADYVVSAYEQGKKKGKKIFIEDLKKRFTENLLKAQNLGNDFLAIISRNNIKCNSAFLSVEKMDKFKVLYIIDSKDFVGEHFGQIYNESFNFRKMHNGESFDLRFLFMADSDEVNEEMIVSDGFVFKHNEQAS